MPPPPWTTPEQMEFLQSWFSKYMERTVKKDYNPFWRQLDKAWFEKWPASGANSDEPVKSSKVGDTDVISEDNDASTQEKDTPQDSVKKRKKALDKPKRRRTEAELYSVQYYEDRIKPCIDAEVQAGTLKTRGEILAASRKLSRALLEAESDDVKQSIRKVYDAQALDDGEQEAGTEVSDPVKIQEAIDDLPLALAQIVELIKSQTRWAVSFFCAGPDPSRNWEISSLSCHPNETPQGQSFAYVYPKEDNLALSAFQDFTEILFHKCCIMDHCSPRSLGSKAVEMRKPTMPHSVGGEEDVVSGLDELEVSTIDDGATHVSTEWDADVSTTDFTEDTETTNEDHKSGWYNHGDSDQGGEGEDELDVPVDMLVEGEEVDDASPTSAGASISAGDVLQTPVDASNASHLDVDALLMQHDASQLSLGAAFSGHSVCSVSCFSRALTDMHQVLRPRHPFFRCQYPNTGAGSILESPFKFLPLRP
ncbi:hypothetical protein J3R83DRAFT_2294 [Lanmaoa asiatica]|nr:hypothetical protein J3R83DRAFT_2294 [Lanmaoa asiatica]